MVECVTECRALEVLQTGHDTRAAGLRGTCAFFLFIPTSWGDTAGRRADRASYLAMRKIGKLLTVDCLV